MFLLNYVVLRHGAPQVIISDRGRQLVANVVEDLLPFFRVTFAIRLRDRAYEQDSHQHDLDVC